MECPRCAHTDVLEIKGWWTCLRCRFMRQEASAFQDATTALFQKPCSACQGDGGIDSGGFDPQDYPISIGACPACNGNGTVLDRAAINGRIQGLQDTMDYAAPELWVHLDKQRSILLAMLD